MQAVRFYGIGDLRAETVPCSSLTGDGMLRVRVIAAGICGFDLHNFETGHWVSRLPVTPGHEFAGVIMETRGACGDMKPGQHVVADSRVGCRHCMACRKGSPHLCLQPGFLGEVSDGGFAEDVVLPASQVFPVPASLPLRFAALAEPLSVALHAISRLSPASGAPVVVCGGGTIGGLSALVLARREHPVHVVERHPGRQTLLREVFGSDGPAFVLDTTGSAQLVDTVVPLIGRGGTLVLAGLFRQSSCPDFNLIVEREIDLRGVSAFADEMHEAIALLPLLADHLEAFITPGISLADVPGTCERLLAGGEVKLKTLIAPNGMDYGW